MAFYDDMQNVATELLTEFGKSVTFERITKTFNKITGKDSARSTAEFTTVGVEVPINQRLVDGTRVQAGDRFIIVDSSYAPAMGDRLQDSAFVACAYAQNATSAELIEIGLGGKLTMSGDEQTGTLALGSGVQVSGMSVSGIQAGSSIPFNSGAVAVETQFTHPTLTGDAPQVTASMGFYETGVAIGSPVFRVQVAALDTGAFTKSVYIDETRVYTAAAASGSVRCGVRVENGNLRVWFDGVEVTLSASAVSDVAMYPIAWIQKGSGLDAGDAGKTASIELISHASDMTTTYPAGTVDLCGNQIGYPEVSPSWSIVDIQPIQPASTVIAYRLQVRK